jgi:DNA topoisomerase-1
VDDPDVSSAVGVLTAGRKPRSRFLSVRRGRRWENVSADQVNEYLREISGLEVTAKDFRTWHATVTVAVELAGTARAASAPKRGRQVRDAVGAAAELLGNTPTVARQSYVDPRVIDRFEDGRTIAATLSRLPRDPTAAQNRLDRAVVRLLTS